MVDTRQQTLTATRPSHDGRPGRSDQMGGGARRGGPRGDRRERAEKSSEFDERVVAVDRVSRVVKGGRRIRFRALVVIGDRKSRVGMGVAKAGDVAGAVQKAKRQAERHMITVPVTNETIPHETWVRYSGVRLMLKPASPGTSIIAGGAVRAVIELAGIRNILSKSLGSSNKINMCKATMEALSTFKVRGVHHKTRRPATSETSELESVPATVPEVQTEPVATLEPAEKTE